jgi:hypothetical protein
LHRFKHYVGIGRMSPRLRRLLEEFSFRPIGATVTEE